MIIFRKLYIRLRPENEGMEKISIVRYGKFPFIMNARRLTYEESVKKGYQIESITTKYKHYLEIDLWFFILRFNWIDKNFKS